MNNTQRSINKYKNVQKTGYWNEVVSSNPTFKTVSFGKYKNGERVGLWIEHDDSGYIISKGHYKLGKKMVYGKKFPKMIIVFYLKENIRMIKKLEFGKLEI